MNLFETVGFDVWGVSGGGVDNIGVVLGVEPTNTESCFISAI